MSESPPFTPVPVRARRDGWTPDTQARFILELARTRNVAAACRLVGRSWQTAYRLRQRPDAAGFAAAWDRALAGPDLSGPFTGRALGGVATPITYRGKRVGERRRFDSRLAKYILRTRAPERFGRPRERAEGGAPGRAEALAALRADPADGRAPRPEDDPARDVARMSSPSAQRARPQPCCVLDAPARPAALSPTGITRLTRVTRLPPPPPIRWTKASRPTMSVAVTFAPILLPLLAGFVGGAMNALAGGGTFATLPALIALGLPANAANATSNVALLPGAAASAWAFRDELAPVGGVSIRTLAAITFAGGLAGSALLVLTPTRTFDLVIPWLLLFAFAVLAFGRRAADWLHARVTIGRRALMGAQALLGVYGGYFGGGVGLITTAVYGLLAGIGPRALFAPRTLMLAVANGAAALVFVATGLVRWEACLPMLAGAALGGWVGAHGGKRLPPGAVRAWTLLVTAATTLVFFRRAYW